MKAMIYHVEYQLSKTGVFSSTLEGARKVLSDGGYVQKSKLEDNRKLFINEEYWQSPGDGEFRAKIVEVECINDVPCQEIRNKTLTLQLLIDTGLNAFAAELLAESFDKLSDDLKSRLPEKLVFVIGNCGITLEDTRQKLPVGVGVL